MRIDVLQQGQNTAGQVLREWLPSVAATTHDVSLLESGECLPNNVDLFQPDPAARASFGGVEHRQQPVPAGRDSRHRQERSLVEEAPSAHVVPPELGHRYHSSCDRLRVAQTDFVLVGRFQTDVGGHDRVAQLLGEQLAEQFRDGRLRVLAGQPVADPARVGVQVHAPHPGELVHPSGQFFARPPGPRPHVLHLQVGPSAGRHDVLPPRQAHCVNSNVAAGAQIVVASPPFATPLSHACVRSDLAD